MRTGLAGATCGVVADLSQAFLDHRPGVLGLHCGAVRIGNHLIALTGAYRAGKTTLVARFSSERGITVFCDDILPILPDGLAYGLGIQPRLRLPLPTNATQEFCNFVEHSLTVSDNRYGYINPKTLAPHGTRAPLAAIIVLERQKNGVATLHRLGVAEAAGHLIRQNIADPGAADAYYDQVTAMARGLLCLKLRYTDIEDAIKLLLNAFGSDQVPAAKVEIHPPLPPPAGDLAKEPANLKVRYRRVVGVVPRTIDTELFLWNIEDRNFYRLNPVAAAIWNLLERPASGLDLASTIKLAFPNHDVVEIERDIADLLSVLTSRGLISIEEQDE